MKNKEQMKKKQKIESDNFEQDLTNSQTLICINL